MASWNIDLASARSVVNRTAEEAANLADAAKSLQDAAEGAQAAARSAVVGDALKAAYEQYAALLIANARSRAETACSSLHQALDAYRDADLEMAARAQANAAEVG
ncbi:DUF6507 family protein [Arthrobacter koreensis]|jgi:hypothetical protein|uniref:DUF6507 family protein n=1 Tax=Arthrobacter koreensis TaxID=199136 RepID=A0ABY6FQ82_9MICC|nr:DUF6507 family protein [Arthrobacter koreensis]UYB35360.1 DUF6507 family protein [Arthrobacter koreensis]